MPRARLTAPIALAAIAALGLSVLTAAGAQADDPAGEGHQSVASQPQAVPVSPAQPSGPPVVGSPGGEPWVVSLGDSFISGEAGRWAGNQSLSTNAIDALGPAAYWDAGDRESIERCHRSLSAAIHIGVVRSLNLACSGAITSTKINEDGTFKPGIDFYDEAGRKGQALMLQEFASENNVEMVALSIGGNDFRFSPIIAQCVKDFLVPFEEPLCQENATVLSYISQAAVQVVRTNIKGAILNVAEAMERAGYADSDWTLVLQLYPQPLPGSDAMRYEESGYDRQLIGGCGFRDADLDWAEATLLPLVNDTFRDAAQDAQEERPTLRTGVLDASRAFNERQLCHDAVKRVKARGGVDSWRSSDAVDRSEWVQEIAIINAGNTYQQESLHPNYWGQLALRNCWRQVWNDGDVRGGVCERGPVAGLTAECEPAMRLVSAGPRGASSVSSPDRRSVRVNLRCPGLTVDAGQTALIRGRVTPADADVTVTYQVRRDGGEWRDRASMEPTARGKYRFEIEIPRSAPTGRTYEWRVVAISGGQAVAVSQTRAAVVR